MGPKRSPFQKREKKVKVESLDGLETTLKSLTKTVQEKLTNDNEMINNNQKNNFQMNVSDKDSAFISFIMMQMSELPENIKARLQAEITNLICNAIVEALKEKV